MKLANKVVALASIAVVLSGAPVFAGEAKTFKEKVVIEEPVQWYNAALTTGWDSLYMFRGVNVLNNGGFGTDTSSYGSGLYWTDLSFTWNITDSDFLTVGSWMAFGTQKTSYKELDIYTNYTKTFGDLSLSFGYIFYYIISPGSYYSHELNAKVAYSFDLGFMTITPSLTYFFNIGPDLAAKGFAKAASSYLLLRVDGSVPLYKEIVSLTPWIGFGTNFQYNSALESNGDLNFFNGVNNLEFGLGLPIKINDVITLYGYGAYSYAFYSLGGTTEPSTFWGGAKVTFSF